MMNLAHPSSTENASRLSQCCELQSTKRHHGSQIENKDKRIRTIDLVTTIIQIVLQGFLTTE